MRSFLGNIYTRINNPTNDILEQVKEFKAHIKNAIEHGLSTTEALEALTTVPAQLLGNNKIGNLHNGSYANFTITSGAFFEPKTTVYEHWIRGSRTTFEDINAKNLNEGHSCIRNL